MKSGRGSYNEVTALVEDTEVVKWEDNNISTF